MGIDAHTFNFLKYANRNGDFQKTITIGRQRVLLSRAERGLPDDQETHNHEPGNQEVEYCEQMFSSCFGATKTDSIDNSDYENATLIHDMNKPLPDSFEGQYDTIIDAGCIEHIFDVAQALKNCSLLCRPGGQIIHILPANNFCGHGFWQLSPELFFSLYSEANGYSETEIFFASLENKEKWYRVKPPQQGGRGGVTGKDRVYVLVRTKFIGPDIKHENIQQSDYSHRWDEKVQMSRKGHTSAAKNARKMLTNITFAKRLLSPIYRAYRRNQTHKARGLSRQNPDLIEINLDDLD